tara:strand:- start:878 stop:1282 length:405 start_codon:yes stop_codon:yes gene_type:complete
MDYIIQKSNFNIDSAKHLIENNCYASSVHCSYYASFQYMKHKLKLCQNTTYTDIDIACKNHIGGSHVYVINGILNNLKPKLGLKDFTTIKRRINDLKQFRLDSDYYNIQILIDEASKSLKFSEEIIQTLNANIK